MADDNKQIILEALAQLDVEDDAAWTANGAPAMEAVEALTGLPELKRADVTAAAPKFSRKNPVLDLPEPLAAEEEAQSDAEQPQEEQPEVAEGEATGHSHPELVAAREAYEAATKVAAEAQDKLKAASDHLNKMNAKHVPVPTAADNQRLLMTAIKASQAERVRIAEQRAALMGDVVQPSPLDAARAGKRG